jgi:hypothetical protein
MDDCENSINGHRELLSPELLRVVQGAEAGIGSAIEHAQGNYLVHRQFVVLRFEDDLGIAGLQRRACIPAVLSG